jgi:hypothetical protein
MDGAGCGELSTVSSARAGAVKLRLHGSEVEVRDAERKLRNYDWLFRRSFSVTQTSTGVKVTLSNDVSAYGVDLDDAVEQAQRVDLQRRRAEVSRTKRA